MVIVTASCASRGDEELARRIASAVQASEPSVVNVSELTTFTWDRVFIFPPYTTASEVEKELGFSWSDSSRIASRDDIVMLAFVDRGHVVRFVDQPRGAADFSACYHRGGFPRSDAVFRFSKDANGWRRCSKGT